MITQRREVVLAANNFPPENLPEEAWHKQVELLYYYDIQALNITGDMGEILPDFKALQLRRAYYASVTYVDELIGELMSEVRRLGLEEDTIVMLVGDHGWQLGDHSEWGKQTNFDVSLKVPMMIKIPGLTATGMVSNKLVELVDLFPTLVEAAELSGLNQLFIGHLLLRVDVSRGLQSHALDKTR